MIRRLLNSSFRRLATARFRAATVVLLLASSLSIVTVIASLVDGALYSTPPGLRQPEQLVTLTHLETVGTRVTERSAVSVAAFRYYAGRSDLFSLLAASYRIPIRTSIRTATSSAHSRASLVSADYFELLGARPQAGRFFRTDDDNPGTELTCILSSSVVAQLGHAAESIIGADIQVNGIHATVIGVAEHHFNGPFLDRPDDLWLPLRALGQVVQHIPKNQRDSYFVDNERGWLELLARLNSAHTATHLPQVTAFPAASTTQAFKRSVVLRSLTGYRDAAERDSVTRVSSLLLICTGLILMVATANVAGILVAHFWGLRRTFATMISLGAPRRTLVAVIVTDCLLLSVSSGLLAIAVTPVILGALRVALSDSPFGRLVGMGSISWRVLLVAGTVMFMTGLACAFLAGSLRLFVARIDHWTGRASMPASRRRTWLLAAQMFFVFLFMTVYGMVSLGTDSLHMTTERADAENVLLASLTVMNHGYDSRQTSDLAARLGTELSRSGTIQTAALSMVPPHAGGGVLARVRVGSDEPVRVDASLVSPGYFGAVGPGLLLGREFVAQDDSSSGGAVIVNLSYARRFLGSETALGSTVLLEDEHTPRTVVGVVADFAEVRGQAPATPFLYLPLSQAPPRAPLPLNGLTLFLGPATKGSVDAAQQVLAAIDSRMFLHNIRTLKDQLRGQYTNQQRLVFLAGVIAVVGLLLGAGGLYGLVMYLARLQERDTALRLALGGTPLTVAREACRRLALPLVTAAVLGSAVAMSLGPAISKVFYDAPLRRTEALTPPIYAALLMAGAMVWLAVHALSRIEIAVTLRRDT